jgi:chemotaxis protein histidine kinase CheA
VLFTVKLIGDAFQDDVDPGLAAAVAEAESFDRALMNINNTLTEITGKIQDVALPSRGASERGGDAGGRAGEIVNQQFGTIQERVDLFQDFQDDLTAINEAGLAEREQLEQTYEEARTAIVEAYGRQRAQEEEDWQRRQAREQRRYQRSVEETREQAAESEQEARQDANEALQKLEQDHLDTIQDIIRNADIQLRDAASRLDAAAVARIKTQRDEAIRSENRNFAKQQQALEQQLAEQLTTIQDNLKERLDDLKEFQEIRQAEEEEDREIRLTRLEESNQRELAELDGRYRESIQELKDSIREQRQEVTARYREEYIELTQSWDDREELQITRMAEILRLEEQWWSDRAAIVGGDATRNGTGGGGNGGVGGVDPTPTRAELLDMLENFARERGIPEGVISGLLRSVSGWSDERIAKYIERTFDIDIPGYAMGTPFVPRTGLALVHRGEEINPPGRRSYDNSRQIVVHPGAVQITAGPGMNEEQLGRIFERKMIDLFERV